MSVVLCKEIDDAIVAYIVKKWSELSKVPLGRTIIQKICYFIKSIGVPLDYDFDMYHYGPYSQDLYYRIDDMVADKVVTDKKTCNTANISNLKTNSSKYILGDNADELLELYYKDVNKHTATIDSVIKVFSGFSPTQLELLSTIHYFHVTLSSFYNKPANKGEVIIKVKEAKGDKFEDNLISRAYDALREAEIFNWNKH